MGFLGFRKAKWKDADPKVRLACINQLTYDQQNIFAQLAADDPDARVRAAATRRVNDQAKLESLLTSSDPEVVRLVRERLSSVATKLVSERPLSACSNMIAGINDHKSLCTLTLEAKDHGVRAAVFERLVSFTDVSPAMWSTIAIQDATGTFAAKAVEQLNKRNVLKDVARKAKSETIRAAAQARVAYLEAEAAKPSPEQSRRARRKALDPLVAEANRWALSQDLERAQKELDTINEHRAEVLARFADVEIDEESCAADERIQRARGEFMERAENYRKAQKAAIAAREQFLTNLSQEAPADDGTNATKRDELVARWQAFDTVDGPQQANLSRRFKEELARVCPGAKPAPEHTTTSDPVKEYEVPADLLAKLEPLNAEAESLTSAENRLAARDRFRVLHKEWHNLVADIPKQHPLRVQFLDAYGRFKEAGKAARAARDQRNQERLAQLEKLAAEAEHMATNEAAEADRKARFDALKDLQKRWRAVGAVRPELLQHVRERFRTACDTAFAPLKEFIEAEDWARFANFGNAEALLAEVDALKNNEDLAHVAASIKDIQQRWKTVGPLPGEKREATWQRFKAACDEIYERLQPYFAVLDAQRQDNLAKKLALVEEAEGLSQDTMGIAGIPADHAHKKATAERMKAIQTEWKAIGPVPREEDKALWNRFRAAGDKFFGQHRADIDARNKDLADNLNLKMAICAAVEEFAGVAEASAAGQADANGKVLSAAERMTEVKNFQYKWKQIGHVPRDQVDMVWNRFRTACDRIYATLQDHLAEMDKQRQENLEKKQALIAEVEAILQHENARWFKDEVKEIQGRWRTIGHVPREQMEAINARFRELCDQVFALDMNSDDSDKEPRSAEREPVLDRDSEVGATPTPDRDS